MRNRLILAVMVALVVLVAFPSITMAAVPTVINRNADVNGVVTLHGEITATGVVGDDDERGFVWGLFSFPDPGNVAPGASGYTDNWTEAGSFGVGTYTHDVAGLTLETVYYYRACAHSADGWAYSDEICFFVLEDKAYLELRPHLVQSSIRVGGIPTAVNVGIFYGYSLPIWSTPANQDEQLFYEICAPDRWDGESNIIMHLDLALAAAGESGNAFSLEIAWENVTANEEPIPVTSNLIVGTKPVYSDTQYELYKCAVAIDYDIDAANPIVADDILAFRLRRVAVGGQLKDLDGELIILHAGILFARGDLLGDPGNVVTEGELCSLVEDCDGIATAGDLAGYVTTGEVQDVADVFQGLILLLPLIVFSILAFWKRHPVLFLIVAGIAIVTGLKMPDILAGTTTPLSLSLGILTAAYAFVCIAMAYRAMFRRRGESYGTEN